MTSAPRTPLIRVRDLHKAFDSNGDVVRAVDDVSFDVESGEFLVLLGASGSGKTTTLRILAALEDADSGEISMAGTIVYSSAQKRSVASAGRPIAMMFQSFALWPHMTVAKNIAFPLRHGRSGLRRHLIAGKVDEALALLHIGDLRDRPVSALSGGQQQRVALARAVAQEPKILLMDEPLSALDAKLRIELRVSLKELTRRLAMTTVYVTHDQTEAMMMADRIGVMHHGRLLQIGSPEQLYREPTSLYVAEFFGEINVLAGTVNSLEGGLAVVDTAAGRVHGRFDHLPHVGDAVIVGARQESLGVHEPGAPGTRPARIMQSSFVGDAYLCTVKVGDGEIVKVRADAEIPWRPGDDIGLRFVDRPLVGFAGAEHADRRHGYGVSAALIDPTVRV